MKDFFPDLWDKMYDLVVNNFNKILTFILFLVLGYMAIKIIVSICRRFLNRSKLKGVAGTVETITIFSTKLKTPDNKLIVIPNGTVTSSKIINYTANPTRRLEIILSVAYGTDIDKVKETALAVVKKHPEILSDPAPTVRLTEQADSALKFAMRVWVAQKDYWPVNFDLKEEVLEAFRVNDIRIPFPQVDVHLDK